MGELWICRKQTAKRPFRLEGAGTDLWTAEELCWYLYHSMDGLEEGLMEEPLFLWLSEELKLPILAEALRHQRQEGRHELWCAWFLLKEIGMYTEEELAEYRELCQEMEDKGEFECRKLRADRMLRDQRYMRCIASYRQLLASKDADAQEKRLLGDVHHNLGVALCGLFLFAEAEACFREAYALNGNAESLEAAEQAARLDKEEPPKSGAGDPVGGWELYLREQCENYKKKVI